MTAEKLRVLLEVLQRAPASLAERIICQEVADELLAMVEAPLPLDRLGNRRVEGQSSSASPRPDGMNGQDGADPAGLGGEMARARPAGQAGHERNGDAKGGEGDQVVGG